MIEQSGALADPGFARPRPPVRFRRAGADSLRRQAGSARSSACAWACRAWWRRSAASWACWIIPCTASRPLVRHIGVGVFAGLAGSLPRRPLSFALRDPRKLPVVSRSHRRERGRRHHGRPPSRPAHGSGPIPSRIDSDAGRKLRPEAHGKRGESPGTHPWTYRGASTYGNLRTCRIWRRLCILKDAHGPSTLRHSLHRPGAVARLAKPLTAAVAVENARVCERPPVR